MAEPRCTPDPRSRSDATFDPKRRDLPLLIYDGDCGFCAWWARYWRELTGPGVRYAPYQLAAPYFPQIPEAAFRGAVQYIAPDGRVAGGAEAAFLTLAHAPGRRHWLWIYRRVPGFAAASEAAYRAIAAQRPLSLRLSRWLWGAEPEPARYDLTAGLFLRLLGLVCLAAFLSLEPQLLGLVGSRGILPATAWFAAQGVDQALLHPSVFWLYAGDAALRGACWLGAAAALAVMLGRLTGAALLLAWGLYLSLFHAGQLFMNYQWDLLLLEAGFLGWLLTSGSRIPLWLLRWLLFRFMFLSGAVKLASGDPAWGSLQALKYHLETQPLPTPLAWHAFQLPEGLLAALAAAHFVIELGLPFLVFLPRRPRLLAAAGFLALQLLILATGNFGFFNLLTLALLVPLLDDAFLRRLLPRRIAAAVVRPGAAPGTIRSVALAGFALLSVGVGALQMAQRIAMTPDISAPPVIAPLRLVNAYGVFAHMSWDRREVVIEASDDGITWRELVLPWKPGPVDRAPPWAVPHLPRLDWQLWLAALGDVRDNPWIEALASRLLRGSPQVAGLFAPGSAHDVPPRQLRALLYRYRYATPEEHARGLWWARQLEGEYLAPVTSEDVEGALRRGGGIESLIRWR
ncbi:MAG TPA: lipase maturation factor family protein [Burkholderiales bacterium]|nr:lipase maturation factor family protein [Burkholderiales bacterium]